MSTAPSDISCVDDGAGRLAITGLRAPAVRSEREALALFFEARLLFFCFAAALSGPAS
jgi:hypothetical protein